MSLKTRVGLLAGATALTLTGVSHGAPATQGDDLAQRLAAAEAKIAAMEAANNQNWLTEQRAAEIKGLVQDVLADADTRASLLQAGATAGYDNGFVVGSTDGNWLLRTNFLMQQRFIWNNLDAGGMPVDESRYGFENTRSKLILSGHIVNPSWFFRWDNNFGSPSGAGFGDTRAGTLNAYLGHDFGNGLRVMVGSMKLPLLREELVEAQYQLAVERSILNYAFTGGYGDGVALSYTGDAFRVTGMFSDGARTGQSPWAVMDTEYALTGRAEFMAMGNWDQFNDFTSSPAAETGLLLGGAVHYQRGEFGTPGGPEPEILVLTGDVSLEMGGFNLYGAIVYTDLNNFGAFPIAVGSNPWGFVVQGGYNFMEDWEVFGRFEWMDSDAPGADEIRVLTAGVNRYYAGHNAKLTADIGYAFDSLPAAPGITGWRADVPGEDGQWVIRTQLQLFF